MSSHSSATKAGNRPLTGEELFRTLLDAMPDIVCFKDGDGRWLEANKADLDLFQLQGVDYDGKKDSELAVFSPFYREAFLGCEASDEKAWQAGVPIQEEETIPLPDGGCKVLEIHKIPLFNDDGSRKGLVVLGRDITRYKQTEEELQRRRQQESIVEQLLLNGFRDSSLEVQLSAALDAIVSLPWLHFAPKGGVYLVSKTEPETLELCAQKNMADSLLQHCRKIRFGECLCGKAARERKIICTPTLPKEEQYRYAGTEEQSHYVVPIIHLEQLLGVLMLYGETGHSCNERQRSFLQTVASTLALLIEQQEAEDRLRRSETNLLKAQQIAKLGYWEWRIVENHLFWSGEVCRIFGMVPENVPSSYEAFLEYVHPDDRQRLQDAVQNSLTIKSPYNIHYRIIDNNGMVRDIHAEGEMEWDASGVPVRMFGTVQDVTLYRQGEKQLDLAARVFESSIEGITITDANGLIQSVNKAFTQITGYSPEEVIGKKPSILKSDRHEQAFYQAMWALLRETGKWEGEIWNRRKNGEVYPEQLTITAITDEYGQLTHHVAVFHDLSDIHGYKEQIHFQAYHDALTLLPNRLLLLDRLKVAIRHAQRLTRYAAVLCLDLDNFKHVNDCLGHMAGDILLQQVAERLKGCVAADCTVARLGGDDFAILVEQCDDVKDAVVVAEKILEQFVEPFNLTSYETFITASIGITYFPGDGNDAEILLKNAELAMYRAKNEGKNKYQLFTKTMNAKVIHRLSLENSLRKAVDRNEFLVYYQPKVSITSGEIVGMEALVRWQKKDGKLISPLDFIPLAEETGLIVPIGAYVLRQACLDTGKWLKQNQHLSVSVNLSARQFMQEKLVDKIAGILEETKFSAARLELEVTESVVMGNEQAAIEQLLELKGLGLRLGLDDFGTGYSSLQYLRKMPIDTLKIDRSFIKDLPDNAESSAIAITIISLAEALNLELVVEGVENHAQLQFLRQQNCQEMQIQGYLFSQPVTAPAFSELLSRGPYHIDQT
jgi:diguanylate cyclase (GGDEF)-like protein/PAS domain S-box-containing protein